MSARKKYPWLLAGDMFRHLAHSRSTHCGNIARTRLFGEWDHTPVYIETPEGYVKAGNMVEDTIGFIIVPLDEKEGEA